MTIRFAVLLIAVFCLSCGDADRVRPLPTLDVKGNLECLPWLDESPKNIERNLVDILTGLGVQGIDGLDILGLHGGGGWIWNSEVVDAYYVFTYSVTNEAGEELLGVSGITIDLSDCEFTLMASK